MTVNKVNYAEYINETTDATLTKGQPKMADQIVWAMFEYDTCGAESANPLSSETPSDQIPGAIQCSVECPGIMFYTGTINTVSKNLWLLGNIAYGRYPAL